MRGKWVGTIGIAAGVLGLVAGCGNGGSTGADGEATSGGEGDRYEVRLHRPLQTGAAIGVSVVTHHVVAVTVQGESRAVAGLSVDLHVQLDGTVTVQDASEDGAIVQATLTIDRCVDPVTGAAIFEPGSVVRIAREGRVVDVALEGGQIDQTQVAALVLAFPFRRPGSTFGQELLGTDTTKAIGDTWDLDKSYFTEDLYDEGIETQETNIGGRTALTDVVDCDDARCLVIVSDLHATQATLTQVGDAAAFESGDVQAVVRVHAPTDTGTFLRREETEVTGSFVADFETESGVVERTITMRRARIATYRTAGGDAE